MATKVFSSRIIRARSETCRALDVQESFSLKQRKTKVLQAKRGKRERTITLLLLLLPPLLNRDFTSPQLSYTLDLRTRIRHSLIVSST